MLVDKTGRRISVGCLVDIHIPRIATGLVTVISDSPLAIPGQGVQPAGMRIVLTLDVTADQYGVVNTVYIVGEPPEKENEKPTITSEGEAVH